MTSVGVEGPSFPDELVAFFRFILEEKQLIMLTKFNPIQKNISRGQTVSRTYVIVVFTSQQSLQFPTNSNISRVGFQWGICAHKKKVYQLCKGAGNPEGLCFYLGNLTPMLVVSRAGLQVLLAAAAVCAVPLQQI